MGDVPAAVLLLLALLTGIGIAAAAVIGVVALACAVLYAIPRTSVLGAILLTGYLGGATATQVRVESSAFFFPVVIGVLAWAGLYLRDSRLDLAAEDRGRIGVILGSGAGGLLFHEQQLAAAYAALADRLERPERAVFNLHPPPYATQLDDAPALDGDLRVQAVLGQGEFDVAKFYYEKGANRAALSRFEQIANDYPNFSNADNALWYLGQTFERLKQPKAAVPYYARILTDYPLSPLVGEATAVRQTAAAAFAGKGANRTAIARIAGVDDPDEDDPADSDSADEAAPGDDPTAPDQAQQDPPGNPTDPDHDDK